MYYLYHCRSIFIYFMNKFIFKYIGQKENSNCIDFQMSSCRGGNLYSFENEFRLRNHLFSSLASLMLVFIEDCRVSFLNQKARFF